MLHRHDHTFELRRSMKYGTRKPLYEAETSAQPATVCITGGTGYIAGAIIARLLLAGHTVHATVRDPSNEKKLQFLRTLPGAAARLKFFKVWCTGSSVYNEQALLGQENAGQILPLGVDRVGMLTCCCTRLTAEGSPACMQADLEDEGSFTAPVRGCKYVIHTASPVIMHPPKGKASSESWVLTMRTTLYHQIHVSLGA